MDLTEQHRGLLQAAVDRDDGLLPRPDKLVGAALRRMADRLCAASVAETAPAGEGEPSWFRGAETGPTSLRITDAGRILVSGELGQGHNPAALAGGAGGGPDEHSDAAEKAPEADSPVSAAQARTTTRRPRTKRALLLDLLGRDGGATIDALVEALGWQPHTVRAALTRLRQDGVAIDRVPGEGGTTYRVQHDGAAEASVGTGPSA